jgi:hypothetical protein
LKLSAESKNISIVGWLKRNGKSLSENRVRTLITSPSSKW